MVPATIGILCGDMDDARVRDIATEVLIEIATFVKQDDLLGHILMIVSPFAHDEEVDGRTSLACTRRYTRGGTLRTIHRSGINLIE